VLGEGPRGRGERPPACADQPDRRVFRCPRKLADADRRAGAFRSRPGEQRHPQPGGHQVPDAGRAVGLELDARDEALGRGGAGEDRMQPAIGRQADERLIAGGRERHVHARRQRVARRGHQHQALGHQWAGVIGGRQVVVYRAENQVHIARAQHAEQLRDQAGVQGQAHPGVAAAERGQGRRQVQRPEHLGRTDPHPPAAHRTEFGQVATGSVKLDEHLAGPGQEQLTRMGQRHPPSGPLEQCRAEFSLEPPDLRGYGRLRDMQALSGLGEAAVAHHRVEVGKLSQLHLSRMIRDKCIRK
jgi:hypothetical protein